MSVSRPRHLAGPIYEWQLTAEPGAGISTADEIEATSPRGPILRLPAFDDGSGSRVRLAAHASGSWYWRAQDGSQAVLSVGPLPEGSGWTPAGLTLSDDHRYLRFAEGRPFFWLADTAWSIVFKGAPAEWEVYLDRRARQGFSVLQVTLLPWRWHYTDADGNRPFHDGDPGRPNAAYFARFDQFLQLAAERQLVVCLMLIWGGPRPLLPAIHFSQEQAVAFARYAVARFAAFPVVWSLSGDAEYVHELGKWDAVGAAVEQTDPYGHPTTNHLPPQMNWTELFRHAPWHDFYMIQTGHRRAAAADIADLPAAYARLTPAKAFVNGEPWYEQHPARDTAKYGPPFTAYDARYALWVSVLSGATMGHTYGSQGIWNWKHAGDSEEEVAGPQVGPVWSEALDHPGARHCGIAARLLRRLRWWDLQPAPERVQLDPSPGALDRPACAVVASDCWLVYAPKATGRLTLKGIPPLDWLAFWVDPRLGSVQAIGRADVGPSWRWQAPEAPTTEDWLLVLTRQSGASAITRFVAADS
ncbi:MAG: DUF4038 domain-containing protein [Chloroflexi bacterium]|nr:DUF4038 domain-containing protein [Chloroflexota bacterium]